MQSINDLIRKGAIKYLTSEPGPDPEPDVTYDDFVAHITTLAVDGEIEWRSATIGSRVGTFRTTPSGSSGDVMAGSSWLSQFRGTNTYAQSAVRHGLPSEAEYEAQRTAGRQILVVIQSTTYAATPGLARNGYTSLANSTSTAPCIMPTLLAWVGPDVGGYAIEMQPSLGLGPDVYTW